MITHLLDTSAILAHYRKQSGWEKVGQLLAEDTPAVGLCSVSITELGVRLKQLGVAEADRTQIIHDYLAIAGSVLPIPDPSPSLRWRFAAKAPCACPRWTR